MCPVYFGRLPELVPASLSKSALSYPYKFMALTCGTTPSMAVDGFKDWDYVAGVSRWIIILEQFAVSIILVVAIRVCSIILSLSLVF